MWLIIIEVGRKETKRLSFTIVNYLFKKVPHTISKTSQVKISLASLTGERKSVKLMKADSAFSKASIKFPDHVILV